jgi:hypothetical protein
MASRPARVDQQLLPFDSHYVEVDRAQVHYLDKGQGPVFLGLHGNPTWSFRKPDRPMAGSPAAPGTNRRSHRCDP